MLYGAIASSKVTPPLLETALFSGAGNLTVSPRSLLRAVATLGGAGSLSASASTTNPVQQASAVFSGAGQMVANLANPMLQGSVLFAGAGQMTANLTRPEDSATTAWAAAVVAAGGTVSDARRELINDLILGLKSDGIWTKLDRLWIFAAENSQSALVDLVANSSASLTATNPTFTTDQGFTGVGSGHIDTGYVPSTEGNLLGLDDAHYSYWSLNSTLSVSTTYAVCGNDSNLLWLIYQPDGGFYFRVNDAGAMTALGSAFSSHAGHFIASRSSSSERKLYQDGDLKYTTTQASSSVSSMSQLVISNGTSGVQSAAFSIGSNLNGGSDAANFYSRLATYMTAVGAL